MAKGGAVTSLKAATRLARFDESAFQFFGDTPEHAKKSFFAAVIVAPMFFIWIGMHGTGMPEGTPIPFVAGYEILVYAVGWMLFPVIMWHVTGALDRRDRYAHFIAVYNWVAVIQNLMFFGLDLALASLGASDGARSFFGLVLLMYILFFGWFAARGALGITSGTAVTIIILDFVTALVWEQFTSALVN